MKGLGLAVALWAGGPDGASAAGEESPVAVSTRVSPDPSSIGDVIELEVVTAFPRGITVNLPIGLKFDPLHLVSVDQSEPEPTGEGLRKTFRIELQYFDVGDSQIPSFPLTYVTGEGEVQTLTVPARAFRVESLLANEADPQRKGEDPPISIEYPNRLAEAIIYTTFATLVVALLAWLGWRRYRRREKPVVEMPPVPPHERARAELEGLAGEDLPGQERWQEYYLRLTEIARAYVEGRFEIEALDRTTDELRLELLRARETLAPIDPTELVRFLQSADLVKFARAIASESEATASMQFVHDMVDRTTRPAPAEPGAGAASKPEVQEEVA